MRYLFQISALIFVTGLCSAEIIPENLPDLDGIGDAVKNRCDKVGKPDSYERLKTAQSETKTCVQGLINVDTVKNEIDEAKKTGSMDEVFGKYCKKRPEFKECIKKTVDVAKECMEENEKNALNVTTNIIEQIGDFACFRDGDRIAMFVASGGVTCLQSRSEGVKACLNSTLQFNPDSLSLNSLPTFSIDKKKCDDLTKVQNCIVKDLEDNCEDSTPANIVDALFKFVKKMACKNIKRSIY